jgi:catechol 2,3-dioxygenase-like lactoylglutathione lyase family enzyme
MAESIVPVRVRGVGHTGITVSNLQRSIRFYRDLLGCEVSTPVRAEGEFFEAVTGVRGCRIDVAFARLPGHVIELLQYIEPPSQPSKLRACDPGFMHVCIKVQNLERVIGIVAGAGYKPVGPMQTAGGGPVNGVKVVYVRDPDGVVLELIEEPPGVTLESVYFGTSR